MMATWTRSSPTFDIKVEQNIMTVPCNGECPNTSWSATCECGVVHRWSAQPETFVEIEDETDVCYCDGEGHTIVLAYHYECTTCRREVKPGRIGYPHNHSFPGMTMARLSAHRSVGELLYNYDLWLGEDDLRRLRVVHPDDVEEIVWDLIDTALAEDGPITTEVSSIPFR